MVFKLNIFSGSKNRASQGLAIASVRGSRDLALAPLIVFLSLANASCRRLVYHYQLVTQVFFLQFCLIEFPTYFIRDLALR